MFGVGKIPRWTGKPAHKIPGDLGETPDARSLYPWPNEVTRVLVDTFQYAHPALGVPVHVPDCMHLVLGHESSKAVRNIDILNVIINNRQLQRVLNLTRCSAFNAKSYAKLICKALHTFLHTILHFEYNIAYDFSFCI